LPLASKFLQIGENMWQSGKISCSPDKLWHSRLLLPPVNIATSKHCGNCFFDPEDEKEEIE
jgi:hypothetical protein